MTTMRKTPACSQSEGLICNFDRCPTRESAGIFLSSARSFRSKRAADASPFQVLISPSAIGCTLHPKHQLSTCQHLQMNCNVHAHRHLRRCHNSWRSETALLCARLLVAANCKLHGERTGLAMSRVCHKSTYPHHLVQDEGFEPPTNCV